MIIFFLLLFCLEFDAAVMLHLSHIVANKCNGILSIRLLSTDCQLVEATFIVDCIRISWRRWLV